MSFPQTWSSLSIWSLTSFAPCPSPKPPPWMSSNSVAPSPSALLSSSSGGIQKPYKNQHASVKLKSSPMKFTCYSEKGYANTVCFKDSLRITCFSLSFSNTLGYKIYNKT